MKKLIAKEFLWFIVTVLAAVPLSFLFLTTVDIVDSAENIFVMEFFLLGFLINFGGIYLVRFIVSAFKVISK